MRLAACLLFLFLSPIVTFAWGPEGHEVVVRMALKMMKPKERTAIYALIGSNDPYCIGNWADSIKFTNGTGPWHYVDIPERDEHYNESRDCPEDNCIIAKLELVQSQIRNHSLNRSARREALLYWFHLIGDLYQPFHCYAEQHGGNDIAISFEGEETNLHKLWDNGIIFHKHRSASDLASDILHASHRIPSGGLTIVDAAEKSHQRAIDMKLRNGVRVDSKYIDRAWKMINTCLWEAACMASTIGPYV